MADSKTKTTDTTGSIDHIQQIIINILQEGKKGYKGEISALIPTPTAENRSMWNEDKQRYEGYFLDASGNEKEIYSFKLQIEPDRSMTRSYKRVIDDPESLF